MAYAPCWETLLYTVCEIPVMVFLYFFVEVSSCHYQSVMLIISGVLFLLTFRHCLTASLNISSLWKFLRTS